MISAPASGDTYTRGEIIEVELRFDQAVGVSGTPNLALTLGSATAQAAWNRAGASPTTQVFRHVVAAADRDTDGLSIAAGALTLNGGTIRNVRGEDAGLGLGSHALGAQASHKVNGASNAAAMVTGVSIRSFQNDGWYDHGETIDVRVTFNKVVTVTGSPRLALAIGGTTRQAAYRAAAGVSVDFRYTVADPDHDTDGLSIAAGALTLNGGAISHGGVAAALGLGSHALGAQASHKVDGRVGRVTGVSITSSPENSAGYGAGETIDLEVSFSDNVASTQGPRLAQTASKLALTIGDNTRYAPLKAPYLTSRWNYRSLSYRYTVQTTDRDTDGISIAANALTGSLRRKDGNPMILALGSHALGNQASHKVTGAAVTPRVTRVRIPAPRAGHTFELGDSIQVYLDFNVPVAATARPQLALDIGGTTHRLNAQSWGDAAGSPSSRIVFGHTVGASDRDTDGISIAADALTLPGNGTLRSAVGVDAALGLTAVVNDGTRKVDGSLNPVAEPFVRLAGTAPHNIFLTNGSFIIVVDYTRPVTITGTPTVAVQVGSVTRRVPLSARDINNKRLEFRYTVRHDDRDPDGVSIAADALSLEGGSIVGPGGKAARLRFRSGITNDASFKVGGAALQTPTFGAAVVPKQVWVVNSPWELTLPPATDGDGTLTYSLTGPGTSATTLRLPAGVSYSTSSAGTFNGGRISGTPTQGWGYTHRLTATDADGDTATLDFTLEVWPDYAPSFGDATIDDKEWTQNGAIDAFDLPEALNKPAVAGRNEPFTYTLSPALPGGISRADHRVSGTPTAAAARTQYTWTVTDADGDQASLTFHATVAEDTAPSFGDQTIADLSWMQSQPIAEVTLPAATGGNGPLTYGFYVPSSTRQQQVLPTGVRLDGRVLKGTPSVVWESLEYAWRATDQDGDTAQLTFDLEVTANLMPSFGEATLADRAWTQRQAITAFTLPAATGGDGDLTYTLDPALPAGVSRDAATREVSGTPTAAMAATRLYLDGDGRRRRRGGADLHRRGGRHPHLRRRDHRRRDVAEGQGDRVLHPARGDGRRRPGDVRADGGRAVHGAAGRGGPRRDDASGLRHADRDQGAGRIHLDGHRHGRRRGGAELLRDRGRAAGGDAGAVGRDHRRA